MEVEESDEDELGGVEASVDIFADIFAEIGEVRSIDIISCFECVYGSYSRTYYIISGLEVYGSYSRTYSTVGISSEIYSW